jgi:hypothetical protein
MKNLDIKIKLYANKESRLLLNEVKLARRWQRCLHQGMES